MDELDRVNSWAPGVRAVWSFFEGSDDAAKSLDRDKVVEFMASSDYEVRSIIYGYITEARYVSWITPPLERSEVLRFAQSYLEESMLHTHSGDWSLSPYMAAYEVLRLLVSFQERGEIDELETFRRWLEQLYIDGDERLRRVIVDGILEHAFEKKSLRKAFVSWKAHPKLRVAYQEAYDWISLHPDAAAGFVLRDDR